VSAVNARYNWWPASAAMVCFVAGVALSHRIAPGVRVDAVTLAGDTPALRFLPAGAGPHPIALLAHGITASKETLFRFGEALAVAGFECFAVDLPGHGDSALPFSVAGNTGRASSMEALERVARALGSVDVFIGHSMGAGAGAAAVRDTGLKIQLFIAMGALPNLGEHGPPLLLLAGRFDEACSPARLKTRTDARLVLSSWCDHALEPYDSHLVNAAVEAACVVVGKKPPAAPTRWHWRLVGLVLGAIGALGLALGLPELSPRWAWARGPMISVLVIVAIVLTTGTWFGAAPHLSRVGLLIAVVVIAVLVMMGAGRLGIPRWSFPALAVAVVTGLVIAGTCSSSGTRPWGAYFLALVVSLFALVLLAGTVIGEIAACRGSRRDGDLAMAIFVGYALGQWIPKIT
jgi:pimeloyl-ACP methyl ester carboxylesterase